MNKTIMTVDDSASVRQMVAFTLRCAGYTVVEAVDGRDAMGLLEKESVDMVITDINMPNMDGIELVRMLRACACNRFTPIILLTTESQEGKKREGREAGATGWIVKPFQPDQLLAIVKKIIG